MNLSIIRDLPVDRLTRNTQPRRHFRAEAFFRAERDFSCLISLRSWEIPRPAGENAGLRDDANARCRRISSDYLMPT